ncbi:MAG TPA: hypothetical protein VGW39_14850 [Chthoniobacterales bacterium]|nr:hypothetical protein [Chthoniobacterales bacterium]
MKRLSAFLFLPLGIAALAVIFSVYTRQIPASPPPLKAAAAISGEFAFPNFPATVARAIEFDADEASFDQLTPREQDDQRRDWLLFSIVGDCGLSVDEINRALYDVPAIRQGYLRPVGRFDYGVTRSCCIGDREIVALVPESSDEEQRNHLARISDEHRKNLGQAPKRLHVFTYALAPGATATVTRRETLPGGTFFDEAQGYHEATVSSQAGLKDFIAKTDDLIFAQASSDGIRLGGRKLLKTAWRNITLEDVAAIWQAEKKIHEDWSALENKWKRRWDELSAYWKKREREFNENARRAPSVKPMTSQKMQDLLKQLDSESSSDLPDNQVKKSLPRTQSIAQLQAEHDAAVLKLKAEQDEEFRYTRVVQSSGFSLDPGMDFAGLAADLTTPKFAKLAGHAGYSADVVNRLALAAQQGTESMKTLAHALTNGTCEEVLKLAGVDLVKFETAVNALKARAPNKANGGSSPKRMAQEAIVPLLEIIEELKTRKEDILSGFVAQILSDLSERRRFQAARYDGPLNGTQVGMVLFYTDLLAKLWALDFQGHTPSAVIDGFEPMTRVSVSPIYSAEITKLPSTRLWFGHEDNGFQITPHRSIHFGRNATRIYAASSNPLRPGTEVPPNASSEAFLGWWNDHYEEVARFEPQYQRLNEIMKWSLLIGWLNQAEIGGRLGFLANVDVDHNAWFPEWAKKSTDLKFLSWDKIGFFDRGYKGSATEAMPILVSKEFVMVGEKGIRYISGGVSLASKDVFQSRVPLVGELKPSLLRSGLDYSKATSTTDEFITLRGTRYVFERSVESASRQTLPGGRTVATLKAIGNKERSKFRGRYGELATGEFQRTITRDGPALRIETRASAGEIGIFQSVPLPSKNGLRLGWHSRSIDNGFSLARRLSSTGDDLASVLKTDATVESAAQLGEDFFVKQVGSGQWMKITEQKIASPEVPEGWQSQIADIAPNVRKLNLAWREPGQLPPQLFQEGKWVRGPPVKSPPPPVDPPNLVDGPFPDDFFRRKAEAILVDPQEYRKRLDSEWRGALPKIDELIGANETTKARGLLEDLKKTYGLRQEIIERERFVSELKTIDDQISASQFDDAATKIAKALETHSGSEGLLIRKALVEIGAGRKQAAVEAFNAVARGHEDIFLREIVGRMRSAQTPVQAADLRDFAALTDWRRHLRKYSSGDEMVATVKEGRLSSMLRVANKPVGKKVTRILPFDDAPIYRQSSLTNIDWNGLPSGKSLDQLVPQGEVIRLPRADIAHFLPSELSTDGKTFTRVLPAEKPASASTAARQSTYYNWRGSGGGDDDDEEEELKPSLFAESNYVYLVLDKSAPDSAE